MKKWLWIGGVVVVLVAGLLFLTLSNLGPIIKKVVNSQGPAITKTNVHVDDVGVSLLSGNANLKGLLIGNPKGFSAKDAVKVGSVSVAVDKNSLTGNPVIINKIEVQAPDIAYEQKGRTDNFQAILANVKQSTRASGKTTSKSGQGASSGRKLLIRDFVVNNGKVSLYIAGQTVEADLPEIHLQDIGGRNNGLEPARAVQVLLEAVYRQIQSPEVLASLEQQLGKLNIHVNGVDVKSLVDTLNQVNKETGGITGELKGLLKK
jgi:uncharacterized protein involved in outer membrane biogenesis